MNLVETIQNANKTNNIVFGFRECKKFIKINNAKMIVIARNAPEKIKKEMEHNAGIARVGVEGFEGTSKELGILCGKPYPISVLVIK